MRRSAMRIAAGSLALGLAVLLAGEAGAQRAVLSVTPGNMGERGFRVTVAPREGGMLRFRVTRDLTKAAFAVRTATLEVRDGNALLADCRVEGEPDAAKKELSYVVDLPGDRLGESRLTVRERPGNEGPSDEEAGSGMHYVIRLAAFR